MITIRYNPDTIGHKIITYDTIRYDMARYGTIRCKNDTILILVTKVAKSESIFMT